MKPFAHTAAVVGSRFLLLVFLLLVALAKPARAQLPNIPQFGCGNENEPACLPGLFNDICDTGLHLTGGLYECGCIIPNPFGGCLVPAICFRPFTCTNLSRRLSSADPFQAGWADWALKNQRELAQDEPLNWVTHIATHNSYNTFADGHNFRDFPNQYFSTTDQLRAGARAILFDNYYINGAARLCHSDYDALSSITKIPPSIKNPLDAVIVEGLCRIQLGNEFYALFPSMRYYANGIKEIRNWLDQNPNEIVFVDFEEYVPQMGGLDEDVLAPIRAYFGDMVFTPPPPVPPASVTGSIATASFMGSISTGVLTVTFIGSGTLHVGDQINGASIPPGTFIQSFGTGPGAGTGGRGAYNLSQASLTVVPSETITTEVLTVTAVGSGALHVDEQITDTGNVILPGTFIQSFGTGTGGTGTYNLNQTRFTGSIATGTGGSNPILKFDTGPSSGVLYLGDQITGTGIPAGTIIGCRLTLIDGKLQCDAGNTGPFGGGDLLTLSNNFNTPLTDVPSETITTTLTVPSETIQTNPPLSGLFPDRWPTRREMLAAGKRVIILDNAYFGSVSPGSENFKFARANQPAYPPLLKHIAPLPSEFLFSELETVAGSYSDGTWLATHQRRYPACFEDPTPPPNPVFTDFDLNFHKALFTKDTILVEEREFGEFLGFTVPLLPQAQFGLMSDKDIVDATECNYGLITLDKYSIELHPPDGAFDGTADYLLYETSPLVVTPDNHRGALTVWSWKEGDRGQNGDCAMLEGSFSQLPSPSQPPLLSQRWVSADCSPNSQVQAKFACARPRSQSGKDPLQWEDPLGDDWKVTLGIGTWSEGGQQCFKEFGSDFVFSVPVNGYQNRKLKDAALYPPLGTASDNIWLNYRQHGDGKWVIPSSPAPVAKAGPNQVVECGNSVHLDAGGSYSPEGLTLSYKWQGPFGIRATQVVNLATPGDLPLGVDPVLLSVTDSNGQTSTDSLTVTVQDTTPPVIRSAVANPNSSWPPNHEMFPVLLSVDAHDACDPNVQCRVVSVTSNEGTPADWEIVGQLEVMLRSERSGNGDGRVYTIWIQCTDASGNVSKRAVTVTIAHDQGKSKP